MNPYSPTVSRRGMRSAAGSSLFLILLFTMFSPHAFPQFAGSSSPAAHESANRADGGLRGSARVNPKTLALEFTLSLMNYPGRNGLDVDIGLQYSSKVWRMEPGIRWWYPLNTGVRYVTDVNARFAEGTAAGWTSTVRPPVLDAGPVLYDQDGFPWNDFLGAASALDSLWQEAISAVDGLMPHGNFQCVSYQHQWCPDCQLPDGTLGAHVYICNGWEIGPGVPEPPGTGGTPVVVPSQIFYVPRVFVTMPSGARHEFRRSDEKIACGTPAAVCQPDLLGTFYSVDSTGMRLERDSSGSRLLLSDGSAYRFPPDTSSSGSGVRATEFRDINGNLVEWTSESGAPGGYAVRDTLFRALPDPVPFNGFAQTQTAGTSRVTVPWFGGSEQGFDLKWTNLKPPGCEESEDPDCAGTDGSIGGALEDQAQKLHFDARYFCRGSITDDLLEDPADPHSPANEVLFPLSGNGIRPCNAFRVGVQGGAPVAARFNPVVLESVSLPNGTEFRFRYNRFGEVARITYPTGVYEEFDHGPVPPFNGTAEQAFDQGNRGVLERRMYSESGELQQRWIYSVSEAAGYTVRAQVSSASDPESPGEASETDLVRTNGAYAFGFADPLAGVVSETRSFDENGALVSRTLNRWISEGPQAGGEPNAARDPRIVGTVSLFFESGESIALATRAKFEFESSAAAQQGHFPHLNRRRAEAWDFAAIPVADAVGMAFEEASGRVGTGTRRISVKEFAFRYSPGYLPSGLHGLVETERLLDPDDPAAVLTETVFEYDSSPALLHDPGTPSGWSDPQSSFRGNVTAVKRLNTETGDWLTERFAFDKFGNPVRSWDASGDQSIFTRTEFSADFAFAFPTAIELPPADPGGLTGSPQPFRTEKAYDLNTGLLVSVTDLQDLASETDDRVTVTRYDDPLLRVTAVEGPAGQKTLNEYTDSPGNTALRKRVLIDPGVWSESVSVADGFGRIVRTEDERAEGRSVVLTEYDLRGRVRRVSEPFLEGSPETDRTWRTYVRDASGKVARSYLKLADGTEALESTFRSGFYGGPGPATVWSVRTDASGRSWRRLSDIAGRVVRVDEPVSLTGDPSTDLGPVQTPARPTYYRYGKRGKVVEVSQGVQRRFFKYDPFGRLVRQKLPEQDENPDLRGFDPESGNSAWSSSFEYDRLGNLLKATDANGVVISSKYDLHGRLTSRVYSDGTPRADLVYDLAPNGKGEVIRAFNSSSSTNVLSFDRTGNPVRVEQETAGRKYPLEYEYTLSGEIKSESLPSGKKVSTALDVFGDIRRLSVALDGTDRTYANAFRYAPNGKTTVIQLGNGRWENAKFDSAGRLAALGFGYSAEDAALWKADYGYRHHAGSPSGADSGNGAVTRIAVSSDAWPGAFVQDFVYGPSGTLGHAEEKRNGVEVWEQDFEFDRFGNRTVYRTVIGGVTRDSSYEFDSLTNRFAASSGIQYDRNGNVVRGPNGREFHYDGKNQLVEVRSPDGVQIARYEYDANGKRVRTVTPLETRVFVYSLGRLASEYSTRANEGSSVFVTADHLGTPRVITRHDGGIEARRDFLPFGEEIFQGVGHRTGSTGYPQTPPETGTGFAGFHEDPESGFAHSDARKYDGSAGRFTSVDPMLESADAEDPRTLNRYSYTLNDPVNLVDPTGLAPVDDWYIGRDGKIEVYRTEDPFDRFYVFDQNKRVFSLVAQLEKNPYGLVKFPYKGYGFTSYNSGERGGYDPNTGENVGSGDHYLLPVTAAALFGLTNQAKNDHGITIALGDMSSSNGSDPWDARLRSPTWNGHHSSHGHLGNGVGAHIDFRYVDRNGNSRRGNWAVNPGLFDRSKNQALFDLAKKWGFSKSLRGYNAPIRHTRAAGKHNDHGHLGFDLRRKRPVRIYQDRRKYYLRTSDFTLDCLVERCVGR